MLGSGGAKAKHACCSGIVGPNGIMRKGLRRPSMHAAHRWCLQACCCRLQQADAADCMGPRCVMLSSLEKVAGRSGLRAAHLLRDLLVICKRVLSSVHSIWERMGCAVGWREQRKINFEDDVHPARCT